MEKIKIEVFSSPGCGKCGHAKKMLRNMIEEMNAERLEWREINILDDMDYSVEMGVLSTPAIAIDGKLVFAGLPSAKKLKKYLENKLNES